MLPHRCTGFPFVLHGHPEGRENHHFRWDRSLNFYSAAELLLPGSESHTRKRSLFSLPTPEWDKPSLGSPGFQHLASCMKPPQPCFQCHHHLSPYTASRTELPSKVCRSCYASSLLHPHLIRHRNLLPSTAH